MNELNNAIGNAWSHSIDREPQGTYIGSATKNGTTFHYYKHDGQYLYETDYDREQRKKAKERRFKRYAERKRT